MFVDLFLVKEMPIGEENWKVLAALLPTRWRRMAWQSRAIVRLRAFPSPDVLLRILLQESIHY